MLPERSWPFRVRPGSFETVDSFLRRLQDANFVTPVTWSAWLASAVRKTGVTRREALPSIVESVGGLRSGHFTSRLPVTPHSDGSTCNRCVVGLEERFACGRCRRGERVEQDPHDGPRVCAKHMMWVGPGTRPEQQYVVAVEALRADRLYRRLRRQGLLDAHRLAEVLSCVNNWAEATGHLVDPATRFVFAVRLVQKVLRPGVVDSLASRSTPTQDRYERMSEIVADVVGTTNCVVLTDSVWLLVRAAGHQVPGDPHSFVCSRKVENVDEREELDQLRSSAYPRGLHSHLTQYVSSEHIGTRYRRGVSGNKPNTYVCARGHIFTQLVRVFKNAKAATGCRVCSNRVLVRGFNSLADTHPHLVPSWHPTKNGTLRPEDVMAGSKDIVFWICERGHWYDLSLAKRKKGVGCRYCANRQADASINSFSRTHPEAVADWHPTLNGDRTPDHFVAGSKEEAWWVCDEHGHYSMQIQNYVLRGHRCKYCSRQEVHPTTCFAVTHPDAAARWHPSRNGSMTPSDVLAGTAAKYWWQCEAKNHHYFAPVATQARGNGCNICSGHVIDDQNCMRATRPDLALQFHPTQNGPLTPDNVLASTSKTIVWLCENGHHWSATGRQRVRYGTGCRYCSNFDVWVGWNDMVTTNPELVLEWDCDNNGDLSPRDVVAGTNKRIAWSCSLCGYKWTAPGSNRMGGNGCLGCHHAWRREKFA